jgi:WD40 repeat protein/serine/threonine protein kinase
MRWPLAQDYNEAVQNPAQCFGDDELRRSLPTLNPLGLPLPCSGNFADVYQLHSPTTGRSWAIKCFTRRVPGLRERYREISAHLAQANLPFAVEFQYLEQGIRVHGQWFPALKMHWVEGLPLNTFVKAHLDRPEVLAVVRQVWLRLAQRLRAARVAHGDLQHGNVLVLPGTGAEAPSVKLIDYDGMWVPALAGSPPGEVGHPAYQHPQRLREGVYSPEIDRFSNLAIYTALRCLEVRGATLWERHDNGDNLLFGPQDFARPGKSQLFRELWGLEDSEARALAGWLALASLGPLERVPSLEEVAPQGRATPLTPEQVDRMEALLDGRAVAPGLPALVPRPADRRQKPKESELAARGRDVTATPRSSLPVLSQITRTKDSPLRQGTQLRPDHQGRMLRALWLAVAGGALLFLGLLAGVIASEISRAKREVVEATPVTPQEGERTHQPADQVTAPERSKSPAPSGGDQNPPAGHVQREETESQPRRRRQLTLSGHLGQILSVAYSRDGTQIVTGSRDGTVRIWSAKSGAELLTLQVHDQAEVWSVAFGPDNVRVASANGIRFQTQLGELRVWDTTTGQALTLGDPYAENVSCVAFSSDGKRIVSGGQPLVSGARDPVVKVWDADTGKELLTFRRHSGRIRNVAFGPDGKYVASASPNESVRVWDVETGKELVSLPSQSGIFAWATNCNRLAVLNQPREITIWDLGDGEEVINRIKPREDVTSLDGPFDKLITSLACSPDGKLIAGVDTRKTVYIWESKTGRQVLELPRSLTSFGYALAFSPDGKSLVLSDTLNRATVWNVQSVP